MTVPVLWEFCERPGFGHDYRFRDLHRERKTLLHKGDPDYARGGCGTGVLSSGCVPVPDCA